MRPEKSNPCKENKDWFCHQFENFGIRSYPYIIVRKQYLWYNNYLEKLIPNESEN